MPSQREIGVDAFLENDQAKLLEARYRRLGERLVREVGERLSSPHAEGLTQPRRRDLRIHTGGRADEILEAEQVELRALEAERVARRLRDQALAALSSALRSWETRTLSAAESARCSTQS